MPETKKILIVDDDKDYADALTIVLENNGYQVKHASSIGEGHEAIEKERPDLIILDVMMEKFTDGFDFLRILKEDENLKNIPVLMVTAVTEKTGFKFSPETDGEYCPADDFVSKPIPVSALLSRVNKLIQSSNT
ncbi:MAG TPA: response regulator [Desulfobacteraceae bacterium]|nr:response regulator [Desulfobacteraceae bacterium]